MSLSSKAYSIFLRDVFLLGCKITTSALLARLLGPDAMGRFVAALLLSSYIESFGRLHLDDASVYLIGKGKASINEMFWLNAIIGFVMSATIALALLSAYNFIAPMLFQSSNSDLFVEYCLALLFSILRFQQINLSKLLISKEDIQNLNRSVLLEACSSLILCLVLLVGLRMGVVGALLGSVLGSFFSVAYSSSILRRDILKWPKLQFSQLAEAWRFAFPHYIAGIIAQVHVYSSNLATVLLLPPSQLAFFSIAKDRSLMLFSRIPEALNVLLFPRIAGMKDLQAARHLVCQAIKINFILLSAAGTLFGVLIYPLVVLLYGHAYAPAVWPFLILLPGFIMSESCSPVVQYLIGTGRTSILPKLLIIPAIVQVSLLYLIVPRWGIWGAASVFSLSCVTYALLLITCFLQVSSANWRQLLLERKDFLYVLHFFKTQLLTPIFRFLRVSPGPQC